MARQNRVFGQNLPGCGGKIVPPGWMLYQLAEINICCDPVSRFFGRREGAGDAVVSASLADAPKVRET